MHLAGEEHHAKSRRQMLLAERQANMGNLATQGKPLLERQRLPEIQRMQIPLAAQELTKVLIYGQS